MQQPLNEAHASAPFSSTRALRQELLRRGLFETHPGYYLGLGLWYASLFFGALGLSFGASTAWGRLAGAVLLAAFWQQVIR